MKTADRNSLMDNPDFLEELVKLEALPEEDTSEFPTSAVPAGFQTPGTFPYLRPHQSPPSPLAGTEVTTGGVGGENAAAAGGPQFMMPSSKQDDASERRGVTTAQPVMGLVAFFLIMSIGAGTAALVFHDRVQKIVVQWNSASR